MSGMSWHFVLNMNFLILLLRLLLLLLLEWPPPPPPAPDHSRLSYLWRCGSSFPVLASLIYLVIHLFCGHPLIRISIGFQSVIFLISFISEENCALMSTISPISRRKPDNTRGSSFLLKCSHHLLCGLVYIEQYLKFVNFCNLLWLIPHPSLHWIGRDIFLNICLSKIKNYLCVLKTLSRFCICRSLPESSLCSSSF